MKELYYFTFSAVNLIPTTLLIFMLVYWLVVLVGFLDFHFLDFELHSPDINSPDVQAEIHADVHTHVEINADAHAEIHHDVHHDIHHDTQGSGNIGWLSYTFQFFNIGKVPFMIFLSFLILPLWIISLLVNDYFNNHSFAVSVILLFPNLLISLFIAKLCTTPIANLFQKLDNETKRDETFIGCKATILLPVSYNKFGQIEVIRKSSHIVFNAYCADGLQLPKGKEVTIIDYNPERKCYYVQP